MQPLDHVRVGIPQWGSDPTTDQGMLDPQHRTVTMQLQPRAHTADAVVRAYPDEPAGVRRLMIGLAALAGIAAFILGIAVAVDSGEDSDPAEPLTAEPAATPIVFEPVAAVPTTAAAPAGDQVPDVNPKNEKRDDAQRGKGRDE